MAVAPRKKLLWTQKQNLETTTTKSVDRALYAAGQLVGCSNLTCIPVDRTGTIASPVHMAYDAIPEADDTLTLSDLMAERADELILASTTESDGLIDVYWSGGVDSTAVLLALADRLGREASERLTVWATESSIREYPQFWKLRKKMYRFMLVYSEDSIQPHVHFSANHSAIKVTGECGDQLHGSARYYTPGAEAAVTAVLEGAHGEKLKEQAENAPYTLAHWRDWLWWWNFSMKWSSVCWRICALGQTNALCHKAFFRTEKFQAWAQANPNLRADRPYRQALKAYIETFTEDEDYTANKEKIGSLRTEAGNLLGAIKEDGSHIPYADAEINDYVDNG